MKKYIAPAVEINTTEVANMMALSLRSSDADNSPVLTNEEKDWDMWGDETAEE